MEVVRFKTLMGHTGRWNAATHSPVTTGTTREHLRELLAMACTHASMDAPTESVVLDSRTLELSRDRMLGRVDASKLKQTSSDESDADLLPATITISSKDCCTIMEHVTEPQHVQHRPISTAPHTFCNPIRPTSALTTMVRPTSMRTTRPGLSTAGLEVVLLPLLLLQELVQVS